jgi:hypothetical protein
MTTFQHICTKYFSGAQSVMVRGIDPVGLK